MYFLHKHRHCLPNKCEEHNFSAKNIAPFDFMNTVWLNKSSANDFVKGFGQPRPCLFMSPRSRFSRFVYSLSELDEQFDGFFFMHAV